MSTRVLFADDDSMHRDLTVAEVNEAIRYYTWNEWNALASRATEGESGLIPRQEYEAMGIMNCWFMHPEWLRTIEDRVGIDGIIDIGARGRREIGTKVNMLHIWALATAPSFGRGIALELNLHDLDFKADRIRDCFGVVRRLYKGLWGDGPMLTSMRDFEGAVLEDAWIERFAADRIELDGAEARATFQRFNGAAEMMGFLLHFDNRLGVGDHGPYPLDDGGFVLARDIIVDEPAFPWSDGGGDLPYAFTVAMFFAPDTELEVEMMDISTVFTTPGELHPVRAGHQRSTGATRGTRRWRRSAPSASTTWPGCARACEERSAALYQRIAAMSKRERIEAGAMVYTAGFALPVARAAGMFDELVAEHGFLEIHPAVSACYETIISGVATEMIPRLFLTGSWGNPVPEHVSDELSGDDAELPVLHALKVRGFAVGGRRGREQRARRGDRGGDAGGGRRARPREGAQRAHQRLLADAGGRRAPRAAAARQRRARAGRARSPRSTSPSSRPTASSRRSRPTGSSDGDRAATLAAAGGHRRRGRRGARRRGRRAPALRALPRALRRARSARFRDGDDDALAKPLSGSYHDVWMELHEDLLATLGRERTDADE